MSAPPIPNLLSLQSSRRGVRTRGRGSGGNHVRPGSTPSQDEVVQGTDTDAAISRMSAVSLGYLNDPFAQFFVGYSRGPTTRRLPIINRGTYTRTTALDRLVDAFLSGPDPQKQIVSLGAGSDTRSLRLFSPPAPANGLVYHELDFPVMGTRKLQVVQGSPVFRNIFRNPESEEGSDSWSCSLGGLGSFYTFTGIDLRQLEGKDSTALRGLRTDVPTLLISECCMCYLETEQAKKVVKWFTDKIPNIALVVYEPIRPDDSFGRMMVLNLASRHVRLPTLDVYKNVEDQQIRLSDAGFERVRAISIEDIWETWISDDEKERVDSLEGLDEVEEWILLAGHYVVVWGYRGSGFTGWQGL